MNKNIFVLAEIIVAFFPITVLYLFSFVLLPVQIKILQEGNFAGLKTILMYAIGGFGLLGLVLVTRYLLKPTCWMPNRFLTMAFVFPGIIFLVYVFWEAVFTIYNVNLYWVLFSGAPLAVSIHVLYLSRHYFLGDGFPNKQKSK